MKRLGLALLVSCAAQRPPARDVVRNYTSYLAPRTATGKPIDISGALGKVVLVTFIASWCFMCLADLSTLDKLRNRFGPDGYVDFLVGMDLDGDLVLAPFAENYALSERLVTATPAMRTGTSPFGMITELPSRFLFGRDGTLVAAFSGVASYVSLAALIEREVKRLP